MQVGADLVGELLESALLRQQVLALGLERRRLGFHGLERLGQRGEEFEGFVRVVDERVEVSLRDGKLVLV